MFTILLLAIICIPIIYFEIVVIKTIIKKALKPKNTTTNADANYVSDNTHTIRRSDNKPISDDEIPDLIKLGYQHAIEREKQSKNPKFHRTEREEELSFRFEMNHGYDINMYVNSFEKYYELACAENNLNKKIELLKKTIIQYEKTKKWFYQTKGGTIYFQDYYEYMHNSKNECFSYIELVKRYLEECIEEKDYLISETLKVISSNHDGILQKDIYQHLPNVSQGEIQRIIRNLESQGLITREKSKGSYLLTIKEAQ